MSVQAFDPGVGVEPCVEGHDAGDVRIIHLGQVQRVACGHAVAAEQDVLAPCTCVRPMLDVAKHLVDVAGGELVANSSRTAASLRSTEPPDVVRGVTERHSRSVVADLAGTPLASVLGDATCEVMCVGREQSHDGITEPRWAVVPSMPERFGGLESC